MKSSNYTDGLKQEKRSSSPYYEVNGGKPLKGSVEVPGAKNAALPALVAASLTEEKVTLHQVPTHLNDVKLLTSLLEDIGVEIVSQGEGTITVQKKAWKDAGLNREKASKIRHSLLLLGGSARWEEPLFLPVPGGCNIGSRKHDLHTLALGTLGHQAEETDEGIVFTPSPSKQDEEISFHYPTFGGTLNVMFAAAVRSGTRTVLKNAAVNPEVIDVMKLMNKMGAKISWAEDDLNTMIIDGVQDLHGASHDVIGDRIIVSTLISAVGAAKGKVRIYNASTQFLQNEVRVWREAGLSIEDSEENYLDVEWKQPLKAISIETSAYPGFHTDIQPLHGVMMARADGETSIKETILDGRFQYVWELNKLGASGSVKDGGFLCVNGAKGQIASFMGTKEWRGSEDLVARDIRGGAAVVIGALAAEGKSIITNVYQVERGYQDLAQLFQKIGGDIERKA
ncbi:hypothetical protein CHL76_01390 [Marinococcus halophilus]|uniref:UDP-N-acetylglucosamine 1-carboxyvinyltransferase n=1 Tax=Marinococcus halophilus TaxID=1371 RepID=A0A510Y356_MARHA|nr:UDP-N-acetylglucosamine 1-carboxyvinyltransferase [Marinococcus halophilus]OZT81775.1 hypothetical protein CHL76_01390 [Marinococcus halophilus]GEK57735.1 UDP-N-acetylglucosamine 1-carboxyvinyltransferase [Marinococcus halophilus]